MVVASLLAGTRLFRNTGLDLAPGMTPGQYVLIDVLNDQGIDLLNRFEAHLKTLQAEPIGEYGFEPLAGTGPTVPLLDLVRVYEPEFERIVAEERIEPGAAPEAAILAAALLVHRAQAVVDVETGTSIVVQALVHACKTAPPARPG